MARELTAQDWADAEVVWDYHQLHHELVPCSAALVLGGNDIGVASFAAELYHRSVFPVMVISGGKAPGTEKLFPRGEAEHFREVVLACGVPDEAILLEPNARNTGDNIVLSREVFAAAGVRPTSLLLIAMPYMERRAYATCRRQWPEVDPRCASAPVTLREYIQTIGIAAEVVDMMIGDMERIMRYPDLGFAIEQDVPEPAREAYSRLVERGFTSRMLNA
ncbi:MULTISPECIES: YdcF family protein [unclassified Amycolatopsis]|uniref:YdcF family protein n=1 Tax=unclassified Amycolatopsis TaxID=2618356 RepID=UPI00106EF567|nr:MULTISPECIES: YdcF family protein [unclassified Amycolatopsis]